MIILNLIDLKSISFLMLSKNVSSLDVTKLNFFMEFNNLKINLKLANVYHLITILLSYLIIQLNNMTTLVVFILNPVCKRLRLSFMRFYFIMHNIIFLSKDLMQFYFQY